MTSREFNDQAQVHKTTVMTRILQLVHEICTKGIHVTKRDLFYTDVKLFEDQKNSDAVLDDVSCMLGCTRSSLNVVASEKGIVVGRLRFTEDGDSIDCSKARALLRTLDCTHPLASDGRGWQDHPAANREGAELHERRALHPAGGEGCSLHAAGRGPLLQPARAPACARAPAALTLAAAATHASSSPPRASPTWRLGAPAAAPRPPSPAHAARCSLFLKKLKMELKIPVLALMDSDPYGLKILSVYMVGSKNMSYDSSNLTTPDIKWLGVRPSDLDKFNIPEQCRLPMTEADMETGKKLLQEDFVKANPAWVEELELMLKSKEKAEIRASKARPAPSATGLTRGSLLRGAQ